MKKITAFLLIMCMLLSQSVFALDEAENGHDAKVYLFGDDWAKDWGAELKEYFFDEERFVNAAQDGDVLSGIEKKSEYSNVKSGDVVVLSYGIFEKDRPYDKNDVFKKSLEKTAGDLTKKGAKIVFVSPASTMKYNSLTLQMTETKNYYTETTKSFAKKNNIAYVDIAALTAKKANEAGSANCDRIYQSPMELNTDANRMCAFEVFKNLYTLSETKGMLKMDTAITYTVLPSEKSKTFDLLFENEISDKFVVYTLGGENVKVNSVLAKNPDDGVVTECVDGKITVDFEKCEKIQIAPAFCFDASGCETKKEPFVGKVYPGIYDVRVKKSESLKASVYLNGYLIASNLDMPGTEVVENAAEHVFEKFYLENENFSVVIDGLTDKLDYIVFARTNTVKEPKTRIFVGGDSTLCNYYPLERSGNEEDGTVMTGWAMLLENYVDADVVNIAASGYWAKKWQELNFNIVEKEGKKGDIFILQFGINDRYYSSVEEMKTSLGEMIDIAADKGMIPILVSPQISAGYGWGDESDVGKSDGGDYREFFEAVRSLAEEKGCFYVDLTDLSSGWFSEIGRDAVYKKYHIWDYEADKPGDMMHLSYKGADAMCGFFVHGLKKLADAHSSDKWENTLDLLKFW